MEILNFERKTDAEVKETIASVSAIADDLEGVVILFKSKCGCINFCWSTMSASERVYMLELAKSEILKEAEG